MNSILKYGCLAGVMVCSFSCASSEQDINETTSEERTLVWSDEFDKNGAPDSNKWSYDLGDGCPNVCGWGNNELQYYTSRPENVKVEDGNLVIEARQEAYEGKEFTSARIVSRKKGDWKYGYIEVKAKLPYGTGTWPAIWMLPTDWEYGGWPDSGEIDVMEHVGYNQGTVYGTVHTKAFNHGIGTQKGDSIKMAGVHEVFHVYAIDWTPEKIDFLMDGEVFNTFKNEGTGFEAWPFDKPFHLLMNLAVGGNWGGAKGIDTTIWPQQLIIDYVRVYEYVK